MNVTKTRTKKNSSKFDPNLVISIWSNFQPSQIENWRALTPKAKWIFWYPDAIVNLGSHQVLISPYDHFFFKEPYIVEKLSVRTNLNVHFLAEGCNPKIHKTEKPLNNEEINYYKCDLAVAGNVYPYRTLIMQDLPQDIHINFYGNRSQQLPKELNKFKNANKRDYVAGRTKAVAFKLAKVNLNTMHYGEIRGVNVRLFEATACGGFVLSHSGPEISRYFEIGKEIVTFESTSDLRGAVEHYLHSDEERNKIAIAGQERSHKDHTFKIRLSELLKICELNEMLPHERNENKDQEKFI